MSEDLGKIIWTDLTVPNADEVRDFYAAVVGWKPEPVDMGGYADYNMLRPDGQPGAGVCWARSGNAELPPQWLMYVVVEDLDASLTRCGELGGKILAPPQGAEGQRYAVIQDPAGAVMAIAEKK